MRWLMGMFGLMLVLMSATAWAQEGDAALLKACPGLAVWAKTHPRGGSTLAPKRDDLRKLTEPALRNELARRVTADQRVRAPLLGGAPDKATIQAMLAVAADDLVWLKSIIARQGFPTPSMVGHQGVADAWLLVQHADSDPAFQSAVLKVLAARLQSGGIRRSDIALLTDRVLLAQGKPQRYGSQFERDRHGAFLPKPTEDMATVDQRRAAMDLMPLTAYRCMLTNSYGGMQNAGS